MKFLVIGDKMVDRYWCGRIVRMNPEKHSAPLLSYKDMVDVPGGAANVAVNLLEMGADVAFISQRSGEIIKNRLFDAEDGVVARFDLDQECQPIRPNDIVDSADGCCAVIVSDYGKGAIDRDVIDQVRALNLPTFVDTKTRPDLWSDWCKMMFPNEGEFNLHKNDYRACRTCVVKCGARGARLLRSGANWHSLPSTAKSVKNAAGAGDTVIAAYVAAYMAIGPTQVFLDRFTQALRIAMDFAGVAVSTHFTAAPSFKDVYGDKPPEYALKVMQGLGK